MLWTFLNDSWLFYKTHFWALLLIMAPILVPFELFKLLYQSLFITPESGITELGVIVFLGILVEPLIMIPVIFYIQAAISDQAADREKAANNNFWHLRQRYWANYLVLKFLVFGVVLSGLFLLIVPGIFFAIKYAFADLELLLNDEQPVDAMKKSWQSTDPCFWELLQGTVIITLFVYVPFFLLSSLIGNENPLAPLLNGVMGVAFSLLGAFYTVFYFRLFDFHRTSARKNHH